MPAVNAGVYPWGAVVRWYNTGPASRRLVLDCGHNAWRKKSAPIPKRVRCARCEIIRIRGGR